MDEFFRGRMRILLVDDDDALLSFLAKELENRGCDIHQSSSGDEAFDVWRRLGPWELVLTDHRFYPGTKIRDGAQLATAIYGINPAQRMAIMTADPQEPPIPKTPGGTYPRHCGDCRSSGSPSEWSKCCDCCGSLCCRFKPVAKSVIGGRFGPS
jgi:CheY-like chemotaxis protein